VNAHNWAELVAGELDGPVAGDPHDVDLATRLAACRVSLLAVPRRGDWFSLTVIPPISARRSIRSSSEQYSAIRSPAATADAANAMSVASRVKAGGGTSSGSIMARRD